jgi:protein subunit release factor B
MFISIPGRKGLGFSKNVDENIELIRISRKRKEGKKLLLIVRNNKIRACIKPIAGMYLIKMECE